MKMLKRVAIPALITIAALCVLNTAAASSMSGSQSRTELPSLSSTLHIPVITITSYPKKVNVGQDFDVHGILKRDNTGIGNVQVYHGELVNGDVNTRQRYMWPVTTNADGSFTDTFHFSGLGEHDVIYTYAYQTSSGGGVIHKSISTSVIISIAAS